MDLLERDGALTALGEAHEAAAHGSGRVVFVTGEPGIGKTSLVTRFLDGLDGDARVLVGTCDDLSIPRPLGPFRDLAGRVSPQLDDALSAGTPAHDVQALLIAELELAPRPTVLVVEDLHWADDATFDTITVLGRRISSLPALLVLTFRVGEVPPGHPLHTTVGAIRADDSVVLELEPLSESAVAELAGGRAHDVYAVSGGNPFYVTQLLATPATTRLPPSVANAVLGHAARLHDGSRRLLELVSTVPGRTPTSLLDAVMPGWPAVAEEPERRKLLEVDSRYVHFRHELARNAIRASVPSAVRRGLHAEILSVLLAAEADPAEIVHHAEAAGAEDVVAEHALVAARRAAGLSSNREAYSHYVRASHFLDRRSRPEQARLLEELADAAYEVDRLDEAYRALDRAIRIYGELGDEEAVGRCMRVLSRFHWWAGDGGAARRTALEAVAMLEPLGESVELACAYSRVSQLAMLGEDLAPALEWGERALDLATRLGDESTRAHALVNIGAAKLHLDPRATDALLEAHAVADAAGNRHEAARALVVLGYSLTAWVRPEPALRYARQALAYATEHEVHTLASYAATTIGWLRLRAGEWEEAERVTRSEVERGVTVVQLLAKTVLTELSIRRGDADAGERLADLVAQADRTGELQRIVPTLELATEQALLDGTPLPVARFERLRDDVRGRGDLAGWGAIRLAAWGTVAGVELPIGQPLWLPHAAVLRRDWRTAADAFGEAGWLYDRALMLSLLDDEDSLLEAIRTARALGAVPLARRVAARMRELGLGVPQGPRKATRANPAGLTARQLEVLQLLVDGLTNAEIAERLVVSPRTVEHHVSAVLTKLGAASRHDVARHASGLGLATLR